MAVIVSNAPVVIGTDDADLIIHNSESGSGFAWLEGGSGNDHYRIEFLSFVFDVRLAEAFGPAGGIDTVELVGFGGGGISLDDLGAEANTLEKLVFSSMEGTTVSAFGNDLNNLLQTDGGNSDQLDGGVGADTMAGGGGSDTYYVDNSGDVILEQGEGGNEWVWASATYVLPSEVENLALGSWLSTANLNATGNALDNNVWGNSGNNVVSGLAGNDLAGGEGGNDTLLGGDGDDDLYGGDGNDSVSGDAGDDYAAGEGGNDTVLGGAGNDRLEGWDGNDTVDGGAGDDMVFGDMGRDSVLGGVGNDTLDGDGDDDEVDTLVGGAGDDVYFFGDHIEVVVEAAASGYDTVFSDVDATLAANVEALVLEGEGVEGVGNAGNNYLEGNGFANALSGLAGNDVLDGRAGNDTMAGGAGNDRYMVDSSGDVVEEGAGQGTDHVFTSLTFYSLLGTNLENLTLGNGADSVVAIGNAAGNLIVSTSFFTNDELRGLGGNDTLDGGEGGDDSLYGGDGNDVYIMRGGEGIAIELAGQGNADTVRWDGGPFSRYVLGNNIENAEIIGDGGEGELVGNELNNRLTGNFRDNTLEGGAGADTMVGGAGNDTYIVAAGDAPIVEGVNAGNDTVRSTMSHVLAANVENLFLAPMAGSASGTGNGLNNYMVGNSSTNTLSGGAGNDELYGGAGDDLLDGGLGNDYLDGGRGTDQMRGGAGNDLYIVNQTSDVVNETIAGSTGIDTVRAWVTDTLDGGVENLELWGNAGNGTGNALNNLITGNHLHNDLIGLAGNDTLDGGAGNDTLRGGEGGDTYIIDSFGDVLFEMGGGVDTVLLAFNGGEGYSIGASDVDNLTATGNFAFAYLEGNQAFGNVITGNGNNDSLLGLGGNDTLIGAGGNDTLVGGDGVDSMAGGAGNDTYFVDVATEKVIEDANAGYDMVRVTLLAGQTYTAAANVEEITTADSEGTVAFHLTGNAIDNWLSGNDGNNTLSGLGGDDFAAGEGGNDSLLGGDGNDFLWGQDGDDTLDGGAGNDELDGDVGADVMRGGAGNDYYVVDNAGDVVNETIAGSSGIDTVEVISGEGFNAYTLGANVENAVHNNGNLEAITLTGNALGNSVRFEGNQLVATTINTAGGNDTVTGTQAIATGAAIALDGGADSDTLSLILGAGLYNNLSVAGFEVIDLTMNGAAAWTPNAAATAASFHVTGFGDLNLSNIGLGSTFDFQSYTGATFVELAGAGGPTDAMSIVLHGGNTVAFATLDLEILNVNVLSSWNGVTDLLSVAGSAGVIDVRLTGEGSLELALGAGDIVSLIRYSGAELQLFSGTGSHEVRLDDSDTTIVLGDPFASLTLNTTGSDPAGSAVRLEGTLGTLNLVGDDADILRLVGSAPVINAGEFSGDFIFRSQGGTLTYNAGDGVDWLRLVGGANETLNYTTAGELDELDRIEDTSGFDGDDLNATLASDFATALSIHNIENIDLTLTGFDNQVLVDAAEITTDWAFTINLFGGEGTNVVFEDLQGSLNANALSGSVQAFAIDGGPNGVLLRGSSGSDILLSERGTNDTLNGGGGSDVLSGGDGFDGFVFDSALGIGNVDTIQDFRAGVDEIVLDNDIFAVGAAGNLAAGAFNLGAAGAASEADDRIIYDSATGGLYYDADGSAGGAAVRFATLGGGDFGIPIVSAADFLVFQD